MALYVLKSSNLLINNLDLNVYCMILYLQDQNIFQKVEVKNKL